MSIDSTSFFSYIYSSWLTKYLWKAYRNGITLSDIPAISPLDSCSCNIQKFENLWNEELRHRGPTSASLPLVAWRFVRFRVLTSCVLNASSQITSFILQTVLLRKLLEYGEDPERHFLWGMHWVIYIVGFDVLQMILYTWSDIMNQRTALRLKSACLSLLFKKVINLNSEAHKSTDELMNVLSKDSHKIYDAVNFGTSLINGPVATICTVICISMWLSPLALLGLVVFLTFYLIQYWLAYLIDYCNKNANEFTKTRMQKTMEILNSIRLIKINGWEQHFIQNVLNIRSRESKWLWKISYINSLNSSIAQVMPLITIIVMFFMHFTMSHNLTASVAFPICVVVIVQLHESVASMKTSLVYLKDSLAVFNKLKIGLLLEDTGCHITKPYEPSQAVAIVNGSFVYDIYQKQNYEYESTETILRNYINEGNSIKDPEKQKLNDSTFEPKRVEILSNITFKVKKGQLIGICGKQNSGKSSLLLAALGQIKMTNGQLMRQGSCAYVGQKAWIANATIRENILFEEVYDSKRYYEAQVVCKLRQDIKMLPEEDETEIGEDGVKISEALRQKIALARAFYADRDIYFLDDPLSSMEYKLGDEIFEDFMIRALAEKTIILVTHELEYLDRCDYIYIMRDGKIVEHGKHKELMRLGKEYAAMVKSAITDPEGDYANEFPTSMQKAKDQREVKENIEAFIHNDANMNPESQITSYCPVSNCSTQVQDITAMTYYTYVKSLGSCFLVLPIILVYITYAAIGLLSLLRLTWWIEAINVDKENNFTFHKNWFGFCFFLIVLGCIIQSFVMRIANTKIADNFHNALLNKLIQAPIKHFDAASTDEIRNLLLHDLHIVSIPLPSKLDNTMRYIVTGFFTFFVLISSISWFTNYVVFVSILFLFIGKVYRVAQLNLEQLENTLRLPINNFLKNSIQGLSTIRTFKKENDLLSKFQELVDHSSACYFVKGVSKRWLSIRLQMLTATCVFAATSLIVIMREEISPAVAGLTFVYILQVPNIIQMGMKYFSESKIYFASVKRICDYLQTLVNERDNKIQAVISDSKWPTTGSIKFNNVELRYSDDAQIALDHISLTINNAEKIGVLSKNDSGRSALIAAMCRLYELSEGQIFIDGVDISTVDIQSLGNKLAVIPQDPLFYGTIRFFLDPNKGHPDAEIWSTLEKVHLKDNVTSVAAQLNYSIDGKMFSVHEKQRFFFARALLRGSKILLMEESIDANSETASLLHKVIEKEFSDSTIIIIARRLQTALLCDRVLVMDKGKVSEFDSPSSLLANQDSSLKRMLVEDEKSKRRNLEI